MTLSMLIAFAVGSFFIVIVPGPTVTVIVANALRDGAKAGFLNVAGTQAALAVMVLVVALGLETVIALMAEWFFIVKLLGAAYLVWLGIKLWRSDGDIGGADTRKPRIGYFWQGVVVILTNPKILILFGAFIPQFIDPASSAFWQTLLLGGVFMIIATVFDSLYVLLASKAGSALTQNRVRLIEKVSGSLLILGGIWMATLRRAA